MKFCYNTNFILPKQSQRSRSVFQDGSRSLGLFWKENNPSYNQRNTVHFSNQRWIIQQKEMAGLHHSSAVPKIHGTLMVIGYRKPVPYFTYCSVCMYMPQYLSYSLVSCSTVIPSTSHRQHGAMDKCLAKVLVQNRPWTK